ncbi:PREDICTED: uncharacterized protein LOC108618301 [Drosophila arizonae]|uniref:Uncharacterized protein LOC108618301 n=1 Tax=Drosophila arizonae TaxID=7263 RepID=A0ABM1PRC9_DROAR|nr:PREDICTED: uncharacterized protein LOC108618301 [Drosophila arizonae]
MCIPNCKCQLVFVFATLCAFLLWCYYFCAAKMSRMLGKPNTKENLLYKWQVELGEPCLQPLDGYMHCTLCNTLISANRRAQLVSHLYSAQHLGIEVKSPEKKKRKIHTTATATATVTTTITTEAEEAPITNGETENRTNADEGNDNDIDKDNTRNDNAFDLELCAAFKSAKIPLAALNNSQFRTFLHKYTNRPIRDEQFMRWRYNA